jgi:hypothetical protein
MVQSVGQSTPSRVVIPISGGLNSPQPDRARADGSRSIELYRTHCIDWHETDGRGGSSRELMQTIPDFTRPGWHSAHNDDRLQHSIREGKGFMPPMKDKLRPTEVVRLVSLVRNFRGGEQVVPDEPEDQNEPSTPPEPRKAAEPTRPVPRSDAISGLLERSCSSSHGADGHGTAMRAQVPSLPDFTAVDWHQRRSDAQLTASVLEGKGRPCRHSAASSASRRCASWWLMSAPSGRHGLNPSPSRRPIPVGATRSYRTS